MQGDDLLRMTEMGLDHLNPDHVGCYLWIKGGEERMVGAYSFYLPV